MRAKHQARPSHSPAQPLQAQMLLLNMNPAISCDGPLDPATFVSPVESTSAPPSFNASWSPSKTAALGPTNLPVAKTPRAWDRKPCNPSAEQSRIKKVWKRYELRAQPQTQQAPTKTNNGERPHLEKVVKRLRLQSPRNDGETSPNSKANYAPTMWERRRSRGTGRKCFVEHPRHLFHALSSLQANVQNNFQYHLIRKR